MFGYFDGDFRRRPQQSLGGAHKKVPRQQLLERAAQERKHREELRRQIQSATLIQAFIRGCLLRKREVIL
jgi:ubiquitin-protein ligase E3 C